MMGDKKMLQISQNTEGYIIVCLLYGILKVHEKVIYGMKLYEWPKMLHMVKSQVSNVKSQKSSF